MRHVRDRHANTFASILGCDIIFFYLCLIANRDKNETSPTWRWMDGWMEWQKHV